MSRFAQQVLDLALKEAAVVALSTAAPYSSSSEESVSLGPDCVPAQWYDVSF